MWGDDDLVVKIGSYETELKRKKGCETNGSLVVFSVKQINF